MCSFVYAASTSWLLMFGHTRVLLCECENWRIVCSSSFWDVWVEDSVLSVICPQQRHQLWLRSARCQGGRCQAQHGESWRQSSAWRWAAAGCWLRINASIEGHGGQWVVLGRAGARQQPRGRHWQPQTIATHTLTRGILSSLAKINFCRFLAL